MTTEYGDWALVDASTILRTEAGSGVHGIAIPGTDDHDEMGIFIEPPEMLCGLARPMRARLRLRAQPQYDGKLTHAVFRTQPEGARSGPGDTDVIMYSLRRYMGLATKGNPTALLPLFAPASSVILSTSLGQDLRGLVDSIVSRQAVERFLGYSKDQRERIVSGQRTPNRPELVAAHGYDTKYASHALRLVFQGLELAATGNLTLPMPDRERDLVLAVKRGEFGSQRGLDAVLTTIAETEDAIRTILTRDLGPLPATPDWEVINAWMVGAHLEFWGGR